MSKGITCTRPGEKGHGLRRHSNGTRDRLRAFDVAKCAITEEARSLLTARCCCVLSSYRLRQHQLKREETLYYEPIDVLNLCLIPINGPEFPDIPARNTCVDPGSWT